MYTSRKILIHILLPFVDSFFSPMFMSKTFQDDESMGSVQGCLLGQLARGLHCLGRSSCAIPDGQSSMSTLLSITA